MAKGKSQKTNSNAIPLHYKLASIDLIKSEINIPANFMKDEEHLRFSLVCSFKFDRQTETLSIYVEYDFIFKDEIIFSSIVDNKFEVKPFEESLKANEQSTLKFIHHIASLSISHTRGLQSQLIKNTPIDGFYMPIVPEKRIAEMITIEGIKTV